MTVGQQFLIACLKAEDSKTFSALQKRWLAGDERRQYDYITEYYRSHGELIGVHTFCKKFGLDVDEVDAKAAHYLKEVKERYVYASMTDNVPKLLKGSKESPIEKLASFQKLVADLASDAIESRDTLYSDDAKTRIDEYEERVRTRGVTYLSMGSPDMDSTFFGYRKQDLITIGGKAGQGKSWLLVYLAYMLEQVVLEKMEEGETLGDILLITNEMGEEEIKERIDCIKFRLPYKKFLEGTLSKIEKKRYYKGLKKMSASKIRIVYSCQTIDELTTLMGIYQPSAVFIDGSYLMEGKLQEGWEKIVFITRNLKRLAKNFRCPIINTTQLKRGSSKTSSKYHLDGQDEFAYSNSYAQDSDIAIRMFQDADMKYHEIIGMEVVKGRRVEAGKKLHFTNDLTNMELYINLPEEEVLSEVKTEIITDI